nr:zinc finger, CCHC-type [Tanacetum cinerariifolium]
NYNMHNMGKTVNELHAMLKLHEQTLPKSNAPALNVIRAGKVQKGKILQRTLSVMSVEDRTLEEELSSLWELVVQGLRASRKLGFLACTWAMVNVKLLKQLAHFIYVSLVD